MEMELLAHKGLRDHKVFRAQLALLDRRVKQEPPVLPELKALPALLVPSVSPALPELKALRALLVPSVSPVLSELKALPALLVPSVSPALPELKALPALLGLLVQPAQRVLLALLVPQDLQDLQDHLTHALEPTPTPDSRRTGSPAT